MFVLVQPEQSFLQLCRCTFEFKLIDNFVHGDAGESEYAVLSRVIGGAANDVPIIPFEVFGKDIGIEKGLGIRYGEIDGRGGRRLSS